MSLQKRVSRATEQMKAELDELRDRDGDVFPEAVVKKARNPKSAMHHRFNWDDSEAAHQYRLIQARNLITEVTAIYPDGKKRQIYVSVVGHRGKSGGYKTLSHVMNDEELREQYLAQALSEYERVGEKYEDLKQLDPVRLEVRKLQAQVRTPKKGRKAA